MFKDVEAVWSILKHFEAFWSILKHFESFWSILKHSEAFCSASSWSCRRVRVFLLFCIVLLTYELSVPWSSASSRSCRKGTWTLLSIIIIIILLLLIVIIIIHAYSAPRGSASLRSCRKGTLSLSWLSISVIDYYYYDLIRWGINKNYPDRDVSVEWLKKTWPELLDAHYQCVVPGPSACLQDALHMITTGKVRITCPGAKKEEGKEQFEAFWTSLTHFEAFWSILKYIIIIE